MYNMYHPLFFMTFYDLSLDNFYNNFIICVQPAQSNRALTAVNAG